MSRLEVFIHRMQAQHACIDHVAEQTGNRPGPVLELGLGNGRTYDHLRTRFPGREIYVFDREIAAHPECIPPGHLVRLGDFRSTVPAFVAEQHDPAVFVHADIGSSDRQASVRLAADLASSLVQILAPGSYLACDQPVDMAGLTVQPLPGGFTDGRYHLYRRSA